MAGRQVTIEDVARESGVSRQTVSRVLNRHPNVRSEVRQRVEDNIARLGYVPNLSARRMGGAKSFLIIAINDRQRTLENWKAGRGNDWVDQMLHGGMLACEARGYHMLFELVDTASEDACKQLSDIIGSLRPDEIILTPPHSENEDLVRLLEQRGTRFVLVNTRSREKVVTVGMDEVEAATSAARHLTDLGHRQIGFLSGRLDYGNTPLRIGGFRSQVESAGGTALVEAGDFSFDKASTVAQTWLNAATPPTAIIAENDQMAFAVLSVANRLDVAVPDDLSLVSLEDTPGVRFSVPPLTAIRQPTAAIIARACELLIDPPKDRRGHILPFELIVRETTAPCTKA